jgi:hypothetical protein
MRRIELPFRMVHHGGAVWPGAEVAEGRVLRPDSNDPSVNQAELGLLRRMLTQRELSFTNARLDPQAPPVPIVLS